MLEELKGSIPDKVINALLDAGYESADQLKEASDDELYPVKGLRKVDIPKIREALRDPLLKALDPFVAVADKIAGFWKDDYPDTAKLINMGDDIIITVGDFRKLYNVLKEKELV